MRQQRRILPPRHHHQSQSQLRHGQCRGHQQQLWRYGHGVGIVWCGREECVSGVQGRECEDRECCVGEYEGELFGRAGEVGYASGLLGLVSGKGIVDG